MALEPTPGSPIVTLPDGRLLAVSIWDYGPIAGCGVMLYQNENGVWAWSTQRWYKNWQTVMPDPSIPPSQTLSDIISADGGPANFIINLMAYASKEMALMLGFTPQWVPSQSYNSIAEALKAWEMITLIPGQFVMPRPR